MIVVSGCAEGWGDTAPGLHRCRCWSSSSVLPPKHQAWYASANRSSRRAGCAIALFSLFSHSSHCLNVEKWHLTGEENIWEHMQDFWSVQRVCVCVCVHYLTTLESLQMMCSWNISLLSTFSISLRGTCTQHDNQSETREDSINCEHKQENM